MKFLCSNCKAKYQIADEKVVGREVRIKCRKCGEIIDVSHSIAPPSDAPSAVDQPAAVNKPEAPRIAPRVPAAASRPAVPRATAPAPRASGPLKPPPAPSAPRGAVPRASLAPPPRQAAPQGGIAAIGAPQPEPPRLGGGLAGAFSAAVVAPAVAVEEAPHIPSADEWFVGINGSPVGPIKLSELRAKAMAGAVALESLVWRGGLEEWKPLKSFPELAAIIEEGVSSLRASPAVLPQVVAAPLPDPFARLAGDSDTGRAVTTEDWPVPARRLSPVFLWLLISVLMLILGATGTWAFLPKSEIVLYRDRFITQGSDGKKQADSSEKLDRANESGAPAAQSPAEQSAQKSRRAAKSSGSPSAPVSEPTKPAETLKGLSGIKLAGPVVGGPAGTRPPGSGGPPLDQATVQSVVAKYSGSVKRACWQPALDGRDRNAPSSANISVQITVGTSGSVQGVTSSPDPPGYHGLASCIQGRVRSWQFPTTSETTTVNVPFKFFSQ